ncbi:MAG TPA: hypothetical protein VF056_15985 [Thermoleophilaceae bacterium]
MASAGLSHRVEKIVGYPALSELDDLQRREFHEALLEAATFEDLPAAARGFLTSPPSIRAAVRIPQRQARNGTWHRMYYI